MSRNLGTIFLPPAPKIYNDVNNKKKQKKNNDFNDKVGIIRNELLFMWIFVNLAK